MLEASPLVTAPGAVLILLVSIVVIRLVLKHTTTRGGKRWHEGGLPQALSIWDVVGDEYDDAPTAPRRAPRHQGSNRRGVIEFNEDSPEWRSWVKSRWGFRHWVHGQFKA